MEGTGKYTKLFKTGQYGRLYIVSGNHARGSTFRIQVLPEGEIAIPNGSGNRCLNSDAIEVYGVVAGNPGWSESYGWIHKGKWQDDFEKLVRSKESERDDKIKKDMDTTEKIEKERKERISSLLSKY